VDDIGVDFVTKSILTEEGTKVQMQIWDTSSRPDCLRHLGQTFFKGINAVVFCFNVSDKSSLEGLSAWHDRIFSRILKVTGRTHLERICAVVLACKLDEPGEVAGLRGYTDVTLLLHCCYTVVTLLLHCCYSFVTLLLQFCYTIVPLLLHYCYSFVTLLLHYCYSLVTLMLQARAGRGTGVGQGRTFLTESARESHERWAGEWGRRGVVTPY
jgi:hypothetical protein